MALRPLAIVSLAIVSLAVVSLVGASSLALQVARAAETAEDGAAQALLREAATAWTQARDVEAPHPATDAHALKLGLLRKADATLRRIVERHATTPLARSLAQGGTIDGLSMARTSLAIEEFLAESCDP